LPVSITSGTENTKSIGDKTRVTIVGPKKGLLLQIWDMREEKVSREDGSEVVFMGQRHAVEDGRAKGARGGPDRKGRLGLMDAWRW
jgi:hypothetical protein